MGMGMGMGDCYFLRGRSTEYGYSSILIDLTVPLVVVRWEENTHQ
jgi:hypothetical protein